MRIVIIGCGNVGMSYAYSLVNSNTLVDEIILIDKDINKAIGEAMDLNHCLAYTKNMLIRAGNYYDTKDADIVVICAGVNQKPNETRLDLIKKNSVIFKDIVKNTICNGFNGIFLVATNPVDIMTYLVYKYSGFDSSKVIGSGTSLDTARCRYYIGKKIGVNPSCIDGYVIGEHGDSEFIPWSSVSVGMQKITDFIGYEDMLKIEDDVRCSAYKIIEKKKATYYGIGVSLNKITNAILSDEGSIMSLSVYDSVNDVYIGLPCIINRNGYKRIFISLTNKEEEKLRNSIKVLQKAIDSIEGDKDEYI